MPYTEDPAELAGVDVAIVGAPIDELISDLPGTRFGPRAIRAASSAPAASSRRASTGFRRCRSSTSATRLCCRRTRGLAPAIEETVAEVLAPARSRSCSAATTRSPSPTCAPAPRARPGRARPLRHAHRHRRRGVRRELSHGTPMYRLVEQGHVDPAATCRSACAATGPASPSSAGRAARHHAFLMHDVRDAGSGGRAPRGRDGRRRPRLPHRRRRRARPGVRAGHRDAGAGRHDLGRPAVGGRRLAPHSSSSAPTWSRSPDRVARPTSPRSSPTGSFARS